MSVATHEAGSATHVCLDVGISLSFSSLCIFNESLGCISHSTHVRLVYYACVVYTCL